MELNVNEQLVKFFEGGVDHAGRSFDFILDQNDDWFEKTCDFIQWVFPTDESTRQAEFVPVLDDRTIEEIRNSNVAQENLIRAASRMRMFWGRQTHWIREYDHNHLRITRVIKSLRLLVSDDEAQKMKIWLSSILGPNSKIINQKSLEFWRDA